MGLGEDIKLDNICSTAGYDELFLGEAIDVLLSLPSDNELSDIAKDIIDKYNNGYSLSEKQVNVICIEYCNKVNRNIYLLGL